MTNEEALECLKRRLECAEYVDSDYCDIVDLEAIKNAIQALEKQIPAEVKRLNKDDYSPCCPNCGTFEIWWADGNPDAYCWKCGQKLDWGG